MATMLLPWPVVSVLETLANSLPDTGSYARSFACRFRKAIRTSPCTRTDRGSLETPSIVAITCAVPGPTPWQVPSGSTDSALPPETTRKKAEPRETASRLFDASCAVKARLVGIPRDTVWPGPILTVATLLRVWIVPRGGPSTFARGPSDWTRTSLSAPPTTQPEPLSRAENRTLRVDP